MSLAAVQVPPGITYHTVFRTCPYVYQTEKDERYCWLIATPQPFCATPPHQQVAVGGDRRGIHGPERWRCDRLSAPTTPLMV
jgi:hypothetical protein